METYGISEDVKVVTSGASNIISSRPKEFAPQASARYVIVLLRLLGWVFFILFLASLGRTV